MQLRCSARHAAPAAQRASGGLGEASGQGRATNGENAEVGRATPGAALTSSDKRSTTPPLASAYNTVIGPAATPAGVCRGRGFDARAAGPTCGLRVPCGGGECLAALRSGLAGEGGLLARSVHSRQWRTRSKGRSGGSAARSRRDPSREPPLLYQAGRGQWEWRRRLFCGRVGTGCVWGVWDGSGAALAGVTAAPGAPGRQGAIFVFLLPTC